MGAADDRLERVTMAHGAGGRAAARLVQERFLPHLANPALAPLDDGALLELSGRLAISTDAFVVEPLFFPGGDIGKLAVCGTLNDVAMCGAVPRALSAAFVLEEGLPLEELERVVASLGATARAAGVPVVTGDTKVVPRGKADRLFIATTGLGERLPGVEVGGRLARPGDRVLVSGPLGDHGAAILACRAGIALSGELRSDCAAVSAAVVALLAAVPGVHCLRDPTRGGLAAVLHEITLASGVGLELEEARVPVSPATRAACELLGLDPLGLACEGRFVAILPEELAGRALELLRGRPECPGPLDIGRVVAEHPGRVVLATAIGGRRLLDLPEGEPLPRIC
ncbi:MAG TPA: hydrogenase expression/formation protein HypE [Myxococcota bacterium]|nr:hydrogenase expression/formation protein HypE [Myxococcota bacterium]HRY96258.1 hydrogenase expression/formation protein HypE [Myxococcota bacterium]HSA20450.1 hydrogenase expression/formation protein HypE [Myxococcota bacterium]